MPNPNKNGNPMDFQKELETLRLERERLELEKMREEVAQLKAKKEAAKMAAQQQEASIKQAEAAQKREQAVCSHRKGGMDMQGILNGNDTNYSVIKHQMPDMSILVMCTRCAKQWKPSDADYQQAVSFPTDNQMSGSCTFVIPRTA